MTLIENLLHLHKIDMQVRGLQSRVDNADRYLKAQTRELDNLAHRRDELSQRRRQLQATIANVETEITGIDERLEKLREELNSAANNKQYTAVLTEMNTVKEQRSEAEDRVLAEMEQLEAVGTELEELECQVTERSKVRDVAASQYQERQAEVGERLDELKAERVQAASAIAQRELTTYEDLTQMFEGEAMAEILEVDRRHREFVCAACNMQVPFEQVSVLLSAGDRLIQCPTCSRCLYVAEDVRGTLVKK